MGAVSWRALSYRAGRLEPTDERVVEEVPLTLVVNGRQLVTLLTLGDHPLELAVGFLRSEGLLRGRADLAEWREEPGSVHLRVDGIGTAMERLFETRTVTTGCGKGTTFYRTLDALQCRPNESRARFDAGTVLRRMGELQRRSDLYRETGGTHNASLADGEKTLCFRTDIGRHNAVDMLGGWALLADVVLDRTLLLTTGRISSEILVKVVRMGVPAVVSRSAPTALALELARDLGITVVGYARGAKFNVYTHPERIEVAETPSDAPGGTDG